MELFNANERTLNYTDKQGVSYVLKLRGTITIVKQASGTGKTLLAESLKAFKKVSEVKGISCSNILIITEENMLSKVKNVTNHLIIIDKADRLLKGKEDIINSINTDFRGNTYLLFARKNVGIAHTPNSEAEFIRMGNEIRLNYLFNIEG